MSVRSLTSSKILKQSPPVYPLADPLAPSLHRLSPRHPTIALGGPDLTTLHDSEKFSTYLGLMGVGTGKSSNPKINTPTYSKARRLQRAHTIGGTYLSSSTPLQLPY